MTNLDQQKRLWALAFGDSPEMIELFFASAYAPERCCYLMEADTVVSALYWLDTTCEGSSLAYIYGVATHPDFRGRGFARRLMEQTHDKLKEQGYAGAILMPAKKELRQMYAGMGYRECTSISAFSCKAGRGSAPVETVSPEEYARCRETLLPHGGVIQEGENLTYLTTYAGLYKGEDFLLAAVHEENRLFGLELLGNISRAPEILNAMGYSEGSFRIPGTDIPFTMLYPLNESCPKPTYFGFAFD